MPDLDDFDQWTEVMDEILPASPSDADQSADEEAASGRLGDIYDAVIEIRDLLSPATPSSAVPDVVESVILDEVEPFTEIVPFGASGSFFDRNVVVYTGTFKGQSCKFVISADMQQYIWRDPSDGALYCVSSDPNLWRVVGRLFYTDTFDQSDYNYRLFTLNTVIGTAGPVPVLQSGYNSYQTTYTRATSNTMNQSLSYGLFYATDVTEYEIDSTEYRTYIAVKAILFVLVLYLLFVVYRSFFSPGRITI
ncbi:hypothetical protein LBYZC6_51850 [Lacrimispora brassicae]